VVKNALITNSWNFLTAPIQKKIKRVQVKPNSSLKIAAEHMGQAA